MGHHVAKWVPDQVTLSWVVGLKVVKDVGSRRAGSLSVSCSLHITCPLECLILSEPQSLHLEKARTECQTERHLPCLKIEKASVGEERVSKPWGLETDPQNSCKKLLGDMCLKLQHLERQLKMDPWGSGAIQA